ncbi:MAG: hypothetical protein M0T80_05705 [Actinomycetota bacterium]|nr:hypothetical protein [Actinomycetota bacterium]
MASDEMGALARPEVALSRPRAGQAPMGPGGSGGPHRRGRPVTGSSGFLYRAALGRALALVLGAGLLAAGVAACGGAASAGPSSASGRSAGTRPAGTKSARASFEACRVARRSEEVAVVVQSTPVDGHSPAGSSATVVRCVAVAPGAKLAADAALRKAGVETATQVYSFGAAICQVDGVPAHYPKCLPSGAPYWALFVARPGGGWTSASTGVSGIRLGAGSALGLRYDPPTGTAPAPSTAPPLR